MKIAYATVYEALNINSWSGTSYHIAKTLESIGNELVYVDNIQPRASLSQKIKSKFFQYTSKKTYMHSREPLLLKSIAKEVIKRIDKSEVDLIFTPGQRILGELKTQIPTAFYSDATFAGLVDYYPDFSNLHPYTLKESYRMERYALEKSALCVFSSQWAADSAINFYGINPEKVKVIQFGSNFPFQPERNDVEEYIKNRNKDEIQLLFMGVLWGRKGGHIALDIVKKLNAKGVSARLHIVGCQPSDDEKIPEFVEIHGFLNKNNPEQLKKLKKLLESSHFLLLPNKAECTAIIYNEVNSFGVPVLTTDTGGVSSVVKDEKNGYLFEYGDVEKYVEKISEFYQQSEKYKSFALQTYDYYLKNLTWISAGEKLKKYLNELNIV